MTTITLKRPRRKPDMTGSEGKRLNERLVDPEQRIQRLVALAHEFGPERLRVEIEAHERKLNDLRAALLAYSGEA